MGETMVSTHLEAIADEDMRVRIAEKGLAASAAAFVSDALRYAGEKSGMGSRESAAAHIALGDNSVLGYFQYQLSVQIGQYLGCLDSNVKAVYFHDSDASAEEWVSDARRETLIHLVVWAEPRTGALASLLAALDRALIFQFAEAVGEPGLLHLLAAKVVDDDDVWSATGYSALLKSLHQKPVCVWQK
jgi:hypothetical protein